MKILKRIPVKILNPVPFRRSSALFSILSVLLALSMLTSGCAPTTGTTQASQAETDADPAGQTDAPDSGLQKFSYSFASSFDTAITIIGYDDRESDFNQMAQSAEALFIELHQLYDIYHEYPNVVSLMSVNQMAGQGPVTVDPRILDLIEFYREKDALAPGQVNVALGSVLGIWHDHRQAAESGQGTLPSLTELQDAAQHIDPDTVVIDRTASTVEIKDSLTRLDVGAVAKGYATEVVAQYLIEQGMTSGIISAGGSNVRLIGKPAEPSRETWAIGIQNPFISTLVPIDDPSLDVILANNTSIVTSGDYQRYYMVDGVAYHHLIDPQTLMPANHMRAVSIMIEDSGLADFLSTAVFLMPYEDGRKLIDSIPDCEALWIFTDGSVKATDGMTAVLKFGGQVNAITAAETAVSEATTP